MSSNESRQSLNSLNEKVRDSIPCRIEFVVDLLKDKILDPLVDFENTDTEYYLSRVKDENESGESYDTRIVLKKRRLDFLKVIQQVGGRLKYIKSGTTGHTFKGQAKDGFGEFEYAIKVVAYRKKEKYGSINDVRRPENAELLMIKLLSYFVAKKQTPHIVLPIGTFNTSISTFVNLIEENVVKADNEKYAEFVEGYKNGEFYENVSILISEWADRGDLLDFMRKYHNAFTALHWKVIFFQVLSVLAVIQSKYPSFRHNDLKANNVLVQKIVKKNDTFTYRVARCEYKVPNIGYYIKLWDFDFACIPGIVDNKKVECEWTAKINVKPEQNRYYDIHYFFNTLIKKGFCPEVLTGQNSPQELKDFINRIVPPKYQKGDTKYVHKKGRLLANDEYMTADYIIKNDPYFEEFRVKKTSQKNIPTNVPKQPLRKSFSKDEPKEAKPKKIEKISRNEFKGEVNIPDISKFLIESDEKKTTKPTKVTKKDNSAKKIKNKENEKQEQIKVNDLLKGIIKEIRPKKVSKKNKEKSRSRTISEEINDLDPEQLLRYTSTSSRN